MPSSRLPHLVALALVSAATVLVASPVLVKDINVGGSSSTPSSFRAVGPRLLFAATDGRSGEELWISDGTEAGTRLVADLNPGSAGSSIAFATPFQGRLLFGAFDGTGTKIFISDGTTPGTRLLRDVAIGVSNEARTLYLTGTHAFFIASHAATGREWYATDGTPEGTRLLRDINPGTAGQNLSASRTLGLAWGNRFFFYAQDPGNGVQLWASDGTEAGTVRITSHPGQSSGVVLDWDMIVYRDRLYFSFTHPTSGLELWSTDGTPAGTALVANLARENAGESPRNSFPTHFTLLGDKLIFSAYDERGGNIKTLWETNGTAAGTRAIKRVNVFSARTPLVPFKGRLYFSGADDTGGGQELWVTDGTTAGTVLVADLNPTGSSFPERLLALENHLVFRATTSATGNEPYVTDGTAAGTRLLGDLFPGTSGSNGGSGEYTGGNFVRLGNKAYFTVRNTVDVYNLYETDGTPAGTVRVSPADATVTIGTLSKPFFSGFASTDDPVVAGDRLFFAARYHNSGIELYSIQQAGAGGGSGSGSGSDSGGTIGGGVPSRIINLSVRTRASAGNSLIVGFVVGGAGTTGTKPVLIRGIGPSLAQFGVEGVLNDPFLSLASNGSVVSFNDNWGGGATLVAAFASVGAFPLAAGSRDSAITSTLNRTAYTAQVTTNQAGSGIALAEVYDLTADAAFTSSAARLTNISARSQAGSGADALIAGFVISGTAPKRVVVRGVGPSLAQFGVTDVLADPQVSIIRDGTVVASNQDWGGSAELAAAFDAVAAFRLENNTRDAAILATLQPGQYSATVTGNNNTTGTALVEVYELP